MQVRRQHSNGKIYKLIIQLHVVMVDYNTLYRRRRYLLEQIGSAADEIKQIDMHIATKQPLGKQDKVIDHEFAEKFGSMIQEKLIE
jgi:hypothetical protein